MTKHEPSPQSPNPRNKVDPPTQPVKGDRDDATSGSEGGGPRIGYSAAEEAESDRHQFPQTKTRKS
jgi:hypothetical protein